MTNNTYNYGGNYPPVNSREQAPQQSFATSNTIAGDPYYGAQSSATPTRTYSNNDYQNQQYPQQASANNGGGYNRGVYSEGKATPATGLDSLANSGAPEQTPNTTAKSNAHNSYDTTGLGNLAYASGLNYNSAAETVQSTTRYSGATAYEGSARGSVTHQSTPSQVHERAMADNASPRASPATGIQTQRYAPEPAAGMKSGAAYSLPTPSPAYPLSLINSYPQRSANTAMPSSGAPVVSITPNASSGNMQQSQYAPFTPSQPQKPTAARVFKQEQNRQTPTPPVAPVARSTSNTNSNAYINKPLSQASHGPNSQSGRAMQTSPQPAATLPSARMSTNEIHRTGGGQTSTAQNINSQPNQYQPTPVSQLPQTSNYLQLPTQVSTARNQQLPQPPRRPSPDRPTTVDPSHVYNSYHEYQKQIEAAEAEAARLAKLKEAAVAEERRRQESWRAQQQRESADMTGAAVQAAMTLTHTMSTNNAAEPESESEESEEDEQGQASNDADEGNEDGQQIPTTSTSETTSHPVSTAPANLKGKALGPSIPVNMAEPPKVTAVTMEEEMRRMVEKLRDYQSKDPKLFLQVWSSVRKTNTRQSPQPQPEGSQTQGSPVPQPAGAPLQSPPPVAMAPNTATVGTTPVTAPAPAPASQSIKVALQSPDSSSSPLTQAQTGKTKEVINARRRAKRPSRSKAAVAERAAAERTAAEQAEARAAVPALTPSTTIPTTQESTLVTSGKPGTIESQPNVSSTADTPRAAAINQPSRRASSSQATPVAAHGAAASMRPVDSAQPNPAVSSQITGRGQRPSPSANPSPSQQNSTWPTDKRGAIAITASSVLNEIPENAGKKILARQIRDMLEGNPSYIELCEMIEKLGFKMDRARFAKTLLAILPGNPRSKPQPPRPVTATPTSGQTATVPSIAQGQASQKNTPIRPPPAAIAASQAAIIPPLTPGATQAPPPQVDQTPSSKTSQNGIERRPVGRPRKDGLPAGSPRTGTGRGRPRHDGAPVQSSYARRADERLANYVPPVTITPQALNATTTATTAAADTSVSITRASPNAPIQPPLPTSGTAASPNSPGLHSQLQVPNAPATVTAAVAPLDAPEIQPQSHPPPASSTTAPPNASEQQAPKPASQGQGQSAPLTTQEAQRMSLLQAFVAKPWQVSGPDPAEGEAAKSYTSPYQKVVAPPKGGRKTWREQASTQTYPYPPKPSIPNPAAARAGPGPPAHYNPPSSTVTGPPQYGPPRHGPPHHGPPQHMPPQYGPPQYSQFQPVGPCHHHGKPPTPLPANVRIIPDQPAVVPQPLRAPVILAAPLTKEAQARKRTFAEIIDLTKGESSDKGEEQSEKRQRVDAGERINSLSDMHGLKTGDLPTRPTPKPVTFQHQYQHYANTPSQDHSGNGTDNPHVQVTRNPLLEYDEIVKSIDRSLALRRSRYDPKTIARDILISAGKHPAQRSLNGHLKQLKERFTKVDNTSDLSTFRWDIVDPGGAEVGSANMTPYMSKTPANYPRPLTEVYTKYDPSRPSGLRNETSQANFAIVIPDNDDEDSAAAPTAPAPKRRGRPLRNPNAPAKLTAASKRVLAHLNQGTTNSPATTYDDEDDLPAPKRRGRLPAAKAPERPHSVLGQPRYIPFLCEWRGCKAELQNLETLRKHVYIVHGKGGPRKDYTAKPCLWGKCDTESVSLNGDADGGDVEMGGLSRQEEIYANEEAFKDHMEKEHIVPMAWHMGDGPRGSTVDGNESDHTSYLNSPITGRPITPSISLQTVTTVLPSRRRGRAPAKRAWTQWEYWRGPKYVLKPAQREGQFKSRYAEGWAGAGEEDAERLYGDVMRRAAREGKAGVVYSRDMPEELREVLGVE